MESVLHSEIGSLGHPRAALLGFAVALLAHNVLALLCRCVEQAHCADGGPAPDVSPFHLALQARSSYEGLLIAVPPERWAPWSVADPCAVAERLLALARRIDPRRVATSKRTRKIKTAKGCVEGRVARAHVATARVMAKAKLPS